MIRLRHVSKEYRGGNGSVIRALKGVNLTIGPGEFVVITGPSGSGKSTLLFTIGAMLKPTSGEVLLGGTRLYDLSAAERAGLRRTDVGFVFQTFNLIPYLNCLDNVVLPARLVGLDASEARRRATELLVGLGLEHRITHKPAELSVGERQRVALCRSMVNQPKVLLADEPTGNLDDAMTEGVMRLLVQLNASGQTIIMVTHDQRLADSGTRLLGIRDGAIERDRTSVAQGAAA